MIKTSEAVDYIRAFCGAPDAFVLLDPDGHIRTVNQKACELVGMDEDEFVGHHFLDFCVPELQGHAQELWDEACAGEPVKAEYPVVPADVDERRTELSASRIETDDSFMIMLVLRDISEDSVAAEHLRKTNEKLARLEDMQLVAQLAGGLVHDLNNMLAVITSYGELLKCELGDRPELIADVEEIIQAGETASSLSRRLLSVGRRRGSEDDQAEGVDLNADIERLVSFLSRVMPPRVKLNTSLDKARPIVDMSSTQLEQALLNLILNARDAVENDGLIRVETELLEDGSDDFSASVVEIRVTDNGSGIEPEKLEDIFEPFFTTKPQGKGTGMGLPMVFRIVQDAGGTIDVDSEVGRGTTMILRLPTSATSRSDIGIDESTLVNEEIGSERVLVVDGNASSRRLIQRVLSGNGYDVLVAHDQSEAEKIIVNEFKDPDLIILDAPPGNGHARAFTEKLSRDYKSMRFLFTVEDMSVDPADGEEHFLLERPITPTSLAAMVRSALDNG